MCYANILTQLFHTFHLLQLQRNCVNVFNDGFHIQLMVRNIIPEHLIIKEREREKTTYKSELFMCTFKILKFSVFLQRKRYFRTNNCKIIVLRTSQKSNMRILTSQQPGNIFSTENTSSWNSRDEVSSLNKPYLQDGPLQWKCRQPLFRKSQHLSTILQFSDCVRSSLILSVFSSNLLSDRVHIQFFLNRW